MSEEKSAREEAPVCEGPLGNATIEYPIGFDLRIIYIQAEAPTMSELLENTLKRLGIRFTLIQGVAAAPGKKYARMGARVTVGSQDSMNALYREVAKLPGVVTVI